MNITSRPYRILADHMQIYQFMLEICLPGNRCGAPAPFLEYALSSDWMDKSHTYLWRIWQDGGQIVGFCFTESPATDVYFCLRPGYEFLSGEMIAYADRYLSGKPDEKRLVLFRAQTELCNAAKLAGYAIQSESCLYDYFFDKPLDYPLPEGFRFTAPDSVDAAKAAECCWYGFENEGTWNGDFDHCFRLMNAPHATVQHHIAIESDHGEYVCYAGMWWTPENQLAYLEPLCTLPEHRRKGLAAAILSELARRMLPLGATRMTGGSNPFYAAIGFKPSVHCTYWIKE